MKRSVATALMALALTATQAPAYGGAAELEKAIETIRKVEAGSKGSRQAADAWRLVAKADVAQLPEILAGMDGANSLARNWLRSAIDEILDRAAREQKRVPVDALESFVRDTQHNSQARRLAYEWVVERDKTAPERFLPNMLDDPSPELRRDAVARQFDQAEQLFKSDKKKDALPLLQKCLASARDKSQIEKTAARLRDLGQPVDLAAHFGFIMDWKLLGPLPNVKQKGISTIYPPEEKIDLSAEYEGKAGKVRWKDHLTQSENGVVDLYAALGKGGEATAYAFTEFSSAEGRDAEIRLGCYTVLKLWVNGTLVLERGDEYTGMSFDHYIARAHLQAGKNAILLKVCRGPVMPGVPDIWKFQVRVCDETGVAILSTTRPAPRPAEKKS